MLVEGGQKARRDAESEKLAEARLAAFENEFLIFVIELPAPLRYARCYKNADLTGLKKGTG